MRHRAVGVAFDSLVHHDAALDAISGVAGFGVTAGLVGRRGGRTGRSVESWRQSFPGVGAGAGGTEADEDCDGKDGEFRFHSWVWLGTL